MDLKHGFVNKPLWHNYLAAKAPGKEITVNIAELRDRSGKEAKLAGLFLLRTMEESGEAGVHLRELTDRIDELKEDLRAKRIALRFGYRNQLEEFVRCLFLVHLIEIEYDRDEEDVICRLTEKGRSELQEFPPERVLEELAR